VGSTGGQAPLFNAPRRSRPRRISEKQSATILGGRAISALAHLPTAKVSRQEWMGLDFRPADLDARAIGSFVRRENSTGSLSADPSEATGHQPKELRCSL